MKTQTDTRIPSSTEPPSQAVNASPAIMAVDDDPRQLNAYQGLFAPDQVTEDALDVLAQLVEEQQTPTFSQKDNTFELFCAQQGMQALEKVKAQLHSDQPIRVAFLDMRMPPGINGLQTAQKLRELDPRMYIVIVTAHSDVDLDNISQVLREDVLFVRKPFQPEEVLQIARNFCKAWARDRELSVLKKQLEANASSNLFEAILYDRTQSLLTDMADKINAQSGLLSYLSHHFSVAEAQQSHFEQLTVTMEQEALQMSKMVNVLQRLSSQNNQISAFSVRDLIDQVKALVVELCNENGFITFDWQQSVPDDWPIQSYFSSLVLSLSILMTNAIEAIKERVGLSLDQSWVKLDALAGLVTVAFYQHQAQLCIEVIDNGIGCDPDRLSTLTAPGVSTKSGHGGMGLAFVSQFMQAMQGQLDLQSPGVNEGMRARLCFAQTPYQTDGARQAEETL